MPSTYEPIQTYTLGSAATSVNFTSIPATYTDLKLILSALGNFNGVGVRFNSDSSTNYSMTRLTGDGSVADSYRLTNQTRINLGGYSIPSSTTTPMFIDFNVFSYAGSTFKTFLHSLSYDNNGTGDTARLVGLWRSTSAITEINLTNSGGNFNAGTTATLYGIKNA